jgi:hypothetical protein
MVDYQEEIKKEEEKLKHLEEMITYFREFLFHAKQKYPDVMFFTVTSRILHGTQMHRVYLNKATYDQMLNSTPQLLDDDPLKPISLD